MIGSLRGKLLLVDGVTALIEVLGVGYEVEMPVTSLTKFQKGQEVFVYIQQVVREDAHLLYGFYDLSSRALFRELIKVSGVGPKMALAVLSTFDVQSFIQTVLSGRSQALQQIPGVGKKTAERLIVELSDRLSKFNETQLPFDSVENASTSTASNEHFDEAVSAMIALGYKENESIRFVKAALKDKPEAQTDELIVQALALISKGK